MIVLCPYSTSWSKRNKKVFEPDTLLSTGERDSALIALDDLRIVNSKLIELKYEKEINTNLKAIVYNDSLAIDNLTRRLRYSDYNHSVAIRRIKRQRNAAIGGGLGLVGLLILALCK